MALRVVQGRSVRTPALATFTAGQEVTTDDCAEDRLTHLRNRGFLEVFTPVDPPSEPEGADYVMTDYDVPLYDPPDSTPAEPEGGDGDGDAPPVGPG